MGKSCLEKKLLGGDGFILYQAVGGNGMTSSKHMNGCLMEQEALKGHGNFQSCPGFILFSYSF